MCIGASLLLGMLAGCGPWGFGGSQVKLVSYRDPYFPETYRVKFQQCAFRSDASNDVHIAARAVSNADSPDDQITQYLHVHMFWQPRPGRTAVEDTMTDATIRYVVVTRTGTAVYAGTGFVFPKREGKSLIAAIESANLRLLTRVGEVPELLGDARLTGKLVARQDEHATVDTVRELDLRAAGPSGPPAAMP
jgi:hypothetical protein